MVLELEPPQPRPVRLALETLLAVGASPSDPWWQAGIEEAHAPLEDAGRSWGQGEATARPRRTRGAERA